MKHYQRLAALLLAVLLLCGCMPKIQREYRTDIPFVQTPAPAQTPAAGRSAAEQRYGSVKLLTEPTVLVSVFLNAPGCEEWTEEARTDALARVDTALDWLAQQGSSYGVKTLLYHADGGYYTLHNAVSGGEQSEESDALLEELDTLSARIDTADLQAKYSATNIGMLYFLPVGGTSFAMVHYADSGEKYYYEYACLYRYDAYSPDAEPENPATYAHEILHLFGAPDLYEGSTDAFVDEALLHYIARRYPNDIMHSTYDADGTSRLQDITQTISPLTAYCVGLTDTCPELDLFPALADLAPGVFGSGADPEPDELPGAVAA